MKKPKCLGDGCGPTTTIGSKDDGGPRPTAPPARTSRHLSANLPPGCAVQMDHDAGTRDQSCGNLASTTRAPAHPVCRLTGPCGYTGGEFIIYKIPAVVAANHKAERAAD